MTETLRVEGHLHASGEAGKGTTGGGGAGGSILAYVHNFDGEGVIEVTGGKGKISVEGGNCNKVFDDIFVPGLYNCLLIVSNGNTISSIRKMEIYWKLNPEKWL